MFDNGRIGKRVAVIGAGPGGLAAGLALHNKGYDVRVLERNASIKPIGGAILLNTSVLMCLRKMGVDITDLGVTARTEMCNMHGRLRVDMPFNSEVEKFSGIKGWNYGLFRSQLYERMLAHIPPELLVPGAELQDFEFVGDEARLVTKDGRTATADLVVGADGIRSVVSRKLWGDPKLFPLNIVVNLGFTAVEGIDRSVGKLFFSDRVQFGFHPMRRGDVDAFEWWCVEAWPAGKPFDGGLKDHIRELTLRVRRPCPADRRILRGRRRHLPVGNLEPPALEGLVQRARDAARRRRSSGVPLRSIRRRPGDRGRLLPGKGLGWARSPRLGQAVRHPCSI